MTPDLILDPALKYWVLVPISIAMVLVGLARADVTTLLLPGPKLEEYIVVRERQFLQRSHAFKQNNNILTEEEFSQRQQYLIETLNTNEYYAKKEAPDTDPLNQLSQLGSTDALMTMAKQNMMNYVPQTLIMAWVNYFFAGFIVMKLPFPLTQGFKGMLQSGVATPDLNSRYVSSISWYFVNLFGLRPVYSLIMGDSTAAGNIVNQQQQQGLGMPQIGGPGAPDAQKVFLAEAENLQILSHESIFDGIVERILNSDKQ